MLGTRIQKGGSCGSLGKSAGLRPKNTEWINRRE